MASSAKTYSHLALERRMPSEYEIVTSRLHYYVSRGRFEHAQAAFRVIPYEITSMEDLNLPQVCHEFIERPPDHGS